jgi:hypothetical protein
MTLFDMALMREIAMKRGVLYWSKLVIPPGPYKMRWIPGTMTIEIAEETEPAENEPGEPGGRGSPLTTSPPSDCQF